MDVPVPQDVEQIVNVPVGVRQQVLLNGDWVTVSGDVAEYTKKLITSVARSKRKVNLTVVPDSQYVESERESRTRDTCSAVKSMQDWETDVKGLISDLLNRLQAEAPFQVRNKSYRDEVTSQATEKKEDLEADTAKHSSVLETAVSRSTLDGEVSSRDRISQYTIEQTLDVPMPEMVKQLVEVPKTISQNRIQQRTMKQIVDDPVVQVVQIPQVHVVEKTAEIPVMTQRQNHMVQTVQMAMETPQLQIVGEIVRDTQTSDSLGTAPVRQGVQAEIGEVVEIRAPFPTGSASPVFVTTPVLEVPPIVVDVTVPQAVEELVEASKAFSQNRVQQSSMEQIIANPAISLAEKTVEMPDTRTRDKTQHVVNTHVQHVVNTVEAETPIIIETINQVTKHVEIPKLQIVDVPGSQTQEETVPQERMSDRVVQQTVKELKSKFEVGHTNKVHARNQPDKNRWRKKQEFEATQYPQDVQERADLTNQRQVPAIRSVQMTVEVPRVQYIDKVADIPVDVQRRGSIIQAAQHDLQHIDEDVHVSALIQSEVPTIPDTDDLCSNETEDEDRLEHEIKKRRIPMPADAVSESRANESDFNRFDDLVLPSREGKTLFVSIASGDEAEDEPEKQQEMTRCLVQGEELMVMDETDVQSPEQEMVQAIHAEWVQELRDVKNELMHVRELVGVLVRRERSAENKAEVAARRLDRMEREQTEADDAEHEVDLQEALANQSKAVKVLVDKWFVDKGYGFGKAPTGEIVFIHASAVQGAEVLTIGTDAWVQVVNDDARAQGVYRAKRAWGRNAWKAERDKENANKVAQQVRRAAALTAELAAQSEKKTAAVCDQPPGLDELAGHIEAPNMGSR